MIPRFYFFIRAKLLLMVKYIILVTIFHLQFPGDLSAQTENNTAEFVRGKVISILSDNSIIPAANFKLTLHRAGKTNLYSKPIQIKYTGSNGFYYFEKIPFGKYILAVWRDSKVLINKYEVTVSRKPYNDLPPIFLKSAKIKTGTSL